ncbi:MAG: carbonic anhydrase [Acidobacteriota bacterium]
MSAPFSHRWIESLVWACSMSVLISAHAADSHTHGEPAPKAEAASQSVTGEPDIRPNLKALAKKSERREEPDEAPATKGVATKDKDKEKGKDKAKGPEAKPGVSMSELRDLIDQKVAEVRAKQTAAPVVKIQSRSAKSRRDGALQPAMFAPGKEEGIPTPADARKVSSGAHGGKAPRPGLADPHGQEVHWAYSGDTGPESWGMLKPEFQQCMLGKRQSPIDIRDGIPVQLDPIQFDYHPSGFRVIDNGHTIQANVDAGNSFTLQGKRYELVQFHFHRPSEERINGKQSDMVVHLVHKDPEGKLAVIAVLIDQGNAHPMLQLVWNALPLEKGLEQASSVPIDLNLILPERKQYFTYMGSLTTPPCSEGVLWMVMKQPAQMSREQIAIFARMYPMNARPVQSAQGRMIKDGQ